MPLINTFAAVAARGFGFASDDVFGEQSFTSAGTYSFVVPVGVTSLSMVAIGGGGAGCWAVRYTDQSNPASFIGPVASGTTVYGGGGGALAYSNSIAVTPGEVLTVIVGVGGSATFPIVSNPQQGFGTAGGFSSVQRGAVYLVQAGGGANGQTGTGGSVIVGTGFAGGTGGQTAWDNNYGKFAAGGGGGGAGGYTAIGGIGGNAAQTGGTGGNSSGGGGGGGGAGGLAQYTSGSNPIFYAVYQGGAGGGGTGLNGLGANGTGGAGMIPNGTFNYTNAYGGTGGSSGDTGENSGAGSVPSSGRGGLYGGGGGAGGSRYREDSDGTKYYTSGNSSDGRSGAIRIIWSTNPGITRAFPSTNVGQL